MATKQKHVLVTTEHRGVFFGKLKDYDKENKRITIKNAQCCVYWSSGVKGFIGLAVTGPDRNCRVTPAAPLMDIDAVTSVIECAPEAVKAWEAQPWS